MKRPGTWPGTAEKYTISELTSVAVRKEENTTSLAVSGDKVVYNDPGVLCDAATKYTHSE